MSKAFYITSVSNGLVLAHQPSGKPSGVAVENKGDGGDREKWTVEAGDQPNVIALKNASNGEYLHANGGTNWSTVGTGAKQWWKISNDNVTAPGACGLSPVDFPNVYLNHFQGKPARQFKDQIKVHMWKWESSYPYWFSWYFLDTTVEFSPLNSSAAEGSSTSNADVEAKLKALEERENALAQKEADRSAEWDEKMKAVKEREASSTQEEEKRTANYDGKLKELQDREAALAKREEESKASAGGSGKESTPGDDKAQAKRESEIQRKLDDISSAEQKLASDRAALEKSKSDVAAKEKDLRQRQKEFEDQKTSAKQEAGKASSQAGQNGASGSEKSALEKKQQDNAALEQRLARLEDRLEQMKKTPDVASDKSKTNGKVNGKANGATPVDEQSPGCGYKHYKPPRKLNRRVIGIVYQ
ncbi:hypothetical protein Q7P36_004094 [Cladosporium allicinum]